MDGSISVTVRVFAAPREALGTGELDLELAHGATVQDVIEYLVSLHPLLRAYTRFLSVAVNRSYVGMQTELCDGDEVALLPPVGGG
jgi:molybdopterin converting factor subunit 1